MMILASSFNILVFILQLITISTTTTYFVNADVDIDTLLDELGIEGQIGQMGQLDINQLLNDDKTALNQSLLDKYIGEYGIGSVLNNIVNWNDSDDDDKYNVWKIVQYRNAMIQIQQTAAKYNRPPVIWGLDSVHGSNYLYDTIITPQPINIAATFNDTLAKKAGQLASAYTRKAGINWLFSPLLGLAWNSYWSRVYETFGEDPILVGNMAKSMIDGIQQQSTDTIIPSKAAACGKHWLGYSFPHNGHDRSPSWIPKRHLYQYFLLPWKYVLEDRQQPLLTIMESYTEYDGVPNAMNHESLVRILRQELQFHGMLVTDYHEIFNLYEWHHTARDRNDAIQKSMSETSIDMSMIANEPDDFQNGMLTLVNENNNPLAQAFQQRIRTSARRVLELKQQLNMFDESFNMELIEDDDGTSTKTKVTEISSDDLQLALEMTHQSIILTKNENNVLPLDTTKKLNILITGPTSHSQSFQSGGWTGQWQGVNSNREKEWFTYGSTVWEAFQKEASSSNNNWQVSYECGVDILGNECHGESVEGWSNDENENFVDTVESWVGWNDKHGIDSAMQQANGADVIVVCLGEENYTEKPGDIRDLNLHQGQYHLIDGLREAVPDKKIILIYFGGRPRLLSDVVSQVDVVFVGFLPGPLAGDAIVDLVTGRVNPSGRLPITYPLYPDLGGVPYLHVVSDMCTNGDGYLPHWENKPCQVQWPFGHGLSYSQFGYTNLKLNANVLQHNWQSSRNTDLVITLTITNNGAMAGYETVLFFTFDEFRSTTPEYKRLRGYEKVWLEPGASMQVTMKILLDDLRFIGPHNDAHYILEDGLIFRVGVGSGVDCRSDPNNDLCSTPITIRTESNYVAACEAACALWEKSNCSAFSTESCIDSCTSIHTQDPSNTCVQMNNDGWGWTYVNCLENILWNEKFNSVTDCWKLTTFCRDVLATPGMDEYGAGTSPNRFARQGLDPLAISMSLVAGVFASIMIYLAMQGRFARDRSEVEFSAVSTGEGE